MSVFRIANAIKNGKTEEALILLRKPEFKKSNVDEYIHRNTLLMEACIMDDKPVCEELLQNGANTELKDRFKDKNAMLFAAENGSIQCLQLLLHFRANVHAQDREGFTPLHRAAENGHMNCVVLLKENGADLKKVADKKSIMRNRNKTAAELAAINGHTKVADYLQQSFVKATGAAATGCHNEYSPSIVTDPYYNQPPNVPYHSNNYANPRPDGYLSHSNTTPCASGNSPNFPAGYPSRPGGYPAATGYHASQMPAGIACNPNMHPGSYHTYQPGMPGTRGYRPTIHPSYGPGDSSVYHGSEVSQVSHAQDNAGAVRRSKQGMENQAGRKAPGDGYPKSAGKAAQSTVEECQSLNVGSTKVEVTSTHQIPVNPADVVKSTMFSFKEMEKTMTDMFYGNE